jgi:ATP-dependent RNA helicase DeaD
MPDDVFQHLGKVWVGGQQLRISHADAMPPESGKHTPPKKVPGVDKPLRKPGKFNKFK